MQGRLWGYAVHWGPSSSSRILSHDRAESIGIGLCLLLRLWDPFYCSDYCESCIMESCCTGYWYWYFSLMYWYWYWYLLVEYLIQDWYYACVSSGQESFDTLGRKATDQAVVGEVRRDRRDRPTSHQHVADGQRLVWDVAHTDTGCWREKPSPHHQRLEPIRTNISRYYSATSLKAILPIGITVTVPWSVCLSVCHSLSVTFVHCTQTAEYIDTISFAYDSPMSLSDRVIGLTSLSPSSPKFCPKVTLSLLIWAAETFDRKLRPNGKR